MWLWEIINKIQTIESLITKDVNFICLKIKVLKTASKTITKS